MMKGKSVVVPPLVPALLASACAPRYIGAKPRPPLTRRAIENLTRPVGRWDAVMTLRTGATIRVLVADGTSHTGRIAFARADFIRLRTHGPTADISIDDVVRVDVAKGTRRRTRKILGGAAAGALAIVMAGLFFSAVLGGEWYIPPVKTWAQGAAGGAALGAIDSALEGRWRTIYVSAFVACPCPGVAKETHPVGERPFE